MKICPPRRLQTELSRSPNKCLSNLRTRFPSIIIIHHHSISKYDPPIKKEIHRNTKHQPARVTIIYPHTFDSQNFIENKLITYPAKRLFSPYGEHKLTIHRPHHVSFIMHFYLQYLNPPQKKHYISIYTYISIDIS